MQRHIWRVCTDKTTILDEFLQTTGYNRKHAVHLFANWDKPRIVEIDGKPVELKRKRRYTWRVCTGKPKKKRKAGGGRKLGLRRCCA